MPGLSAKPRLGRFGDTGIRVVDVGHSRCKTEVEIGTKEESSKKGQKNKAVAKTSAALSLLGTQGLFVLSSLTPVFWDALSFFFSSLPCCPAQVFPSLVLVKAGPWSFLPFPCKLTKCAVRDRTQLLPLVAFPADRARGERTNDVQVRFRSGGPRKETKNKGTTVQRGQEQEKIKNKERRGVKLANEMVAKKGKSKEHKGEQQNNRNIMRTRTVQALTTVYFRLQSTLFLVRRIRH